GRFGLLTIQYQPQSISRTATPMAASVARFVARLVIGLPSTSSRSARKAPTATRYHPIRRLRRRAGSKGSVMAIASFLSQPLEAHPGGYAGSYRGRKREEGVGGPRPEDEALVTARARRSSFSRSPLINRQPSSMAYGASGTPCGEWRSGAREMRPRWPAKGTTGSAPLIGRGSTFMPWPFTISHSWVVRLVGIARILATVSACRTVLPSSTQFIRMML